MNFRNKHTWKGNHFIAQTHKAGITWFPRACCTRAVIKSSTPAISNLSANKRNTERCTYIQADATFIK